MKNLNQLKRNNWILKKRASNPIWNEWVNTKTGETSLTEHLPRDIFPKHECYFVPIDRNGNVKCKYCGRGTRIIPGLHKLVDGKIKTIKVIK